MTIILTTVNNNVFTSTYVVFLGTCKKAATSPTTNFSSVLNEGLRLTKSDVPSNANKKTQASLCEVNCDQQNLCDYRFPLVFLK